VDWSDAAILFSCIYDPVPACGSRLDAWDVNDDGQLDPTDLVYLVEWLSESENPPPFPHPNSGWAPGPDCTADNLDFCVSRPPIDIDGFSSPDTPDPLYYDWGPGKFSIPLEFSGPDFFGFGARNYSCSDWPNMREFMDTFSEIKDDAEGITYARLKAGVQSVRVKFTFRAFLMSCGIGCPNCYEASGWMYFNLGPSIFDPKVSVIWANGALVEVDIPLELGVLYYTFDASGGEVVWHPGLLEANTGWIDITDDLIEYMEEHELTGCPGSIPPTCDEAFWLYGVNTQGITLSYDWWNCAWDPVKDEGLELRVYPEIEYEYCEPPQ
jgi:hypothetical protein